MEDLCLYCGRFTENHNPFDGMAECDRPECIAKRDPNDPDRFGFINGAAMLMK